MLATATGVPAAATADGARAPTRHQDYDLTSRLQTITTSTGRHLHLQVLVSHDAAEHWYTLQITVTDNKHWPADAEHPAWEVGEAHQWTFPIGASSFSAPAGKRTGTVDVTRRM